MAKNNAGAGGRKHGRNAKKCQRYKLEHRAEKNKVRRAQKRANQMPREEG